MAARPAPIKQSELTRYAKAMQAAGVKEWRVVLRVDGSQEIIVSGQVDAVTANPCDRLLK